MTYDERAVYVYELNGEWWVDCFVCKWTLTTTPSQKRAMRIAMGHKHTDFAAAAKANDGVV